MKYLDVIVSVLSGLTVCLPLAAKLAQYAAQAVRERNWTKLMNLTLRYMGPLIASAFAGAGIGVTLWNRSRAGLDRAAALLTANGAVEMTTDEACFAGAPFVIECIAEDAAQKREFYRRVGPLLAPDGVLATNTSGLSITALAEGAAAPERFCGMHWINPPQLIPLVEVVRGEKTAADTAQSVFTLALRLGKKPILARDVPGFVLNRLQFAVLREALHLVDSGAAGIEDVDGAMSTAGSPGVRPGQRYSNARSGRRVRGQARVTLG